MPAPRAVRAFFEWRWATAVALIAGALAFIALALLLIPTELDSVRVDSLQHATVEASAPSIPSQPVSSAQTVRPTPVPAPAAPPTVTEAEPIMPPARDLALDFSANIADRADRPQRSHEGSQ